MPSTGDEARARHGQRPAPDGEAWDDAAWVDVGSDNHWRPSFEERSRSLVALAVLLGALLLLAAFASLDDGDGDQTVVAPSTTTTTTEATTTTTAPPDPVSIDGETPPEECVFDDRGASPLRDRSDSTVLVLNGTPKGGHAGENNDELEELGYTSMEPGNASIRAITSVEYLPEHCAEGVRLVDDLGIDSTTIAPFESADDDVFLGRAVLVVTLGRDSL